MRSPEELQALIHEVVPTLPLPALELLEELGAIGEEAELTQELAHTLAFVRRATPEPVLSAGFADSVLAALPPGPPPSAPEETPAERAHPEKSPRAVTSGRGAWGGFVASFLVGVGLTTAWGWIDSAEAPRREIPAPPVSEGSTVPAPEHPAEPAGGAPRDASPEDTNPAPEGSDALPSGLVEAGHEPAPVDPAPVDPAPVDPALAHLAARGDPIQSYVARASIVFEALERLDPQDPRVSRALALHLERTELLEQGERLLIAIEYDPSGRRLRPLIRGAQVVLRKVRHVPNTSAPATSTPGSGLSAIRQEVRHTGLLAACRQLLASPPAADAPEPEQTRDL